VCKQEQGNAGKHSPRWLALGEVASVQKYDNR
jgi:hypothetical protein